MYKSFFKNVSRTGFIAKARSSDDAEKQKKVSTGGYELQSLNFARSAFRPKKKSIRPGQKSVCPPEVFSI